MQIGYEGNEPSNSEFIPNVDNFDVPRASTVSLPTKKVT